MEEPREMLYEGMGGKLVPLRQALRQFNKIVEPQRCCHFDERSNRCPRDGAMVDPETGRLHCLMHAVGSDSVH